jgi:hypothetical protein
MYHIHEQGTQLIFAYVRGCPIRAVCKFCRHFISLFQTKAEHGMEEPGPGTARFVGPLNYGSPN